MSIIKRASATIGAAMLATGLGLATAGQASAATPTPASTTSITNDRHHHQCWWHHHHRHCHRW